MTRSLQDGRGLRRVHQGAAHFISILAVSSLLATPIGYAQQRPQRLRIFGPEPHPLTNPSGPVCQTPGGGLGTLPNAIINNRAYQQPGDGQSELTLAAFGNIVVAGFNDCTGFANPDLRNGAVGWAFSTDGAQTWRDLGSEGRLQKVMSTDWGSYADPSLAVDSAGNFYFSKLYSVPIPGGFTPISIAVHKGYFDPNTARVIWGPPTVPFAAPPGTAGADKPHIAVDPNTSGATATVYLAFTDFNAGQVIRIVRSIDGASTWSAPITLSKPGVPLGAIPRVGPIGEIYVAWERNWAQPSGQAIMIAKATAWPSFSSELVVSNVTPLTRIPSFNPGREPNEFPTMGVDTRGRVYLAWNDGRYGSGCRDPGRASDRIGAILLTYSPDGLSNWSSFAVVNDDGFPSATCTDHFYPWLSIDPNDGVHLGWYDNRLRAPLRYDLTDTYAATFNIVGGVSPNIRLTSCTFSTNVQSTCRLVFGDYNGGYATIDRFHYAWGDGRNGDPDAFSGGLPLR